MGVLTEADLERRRGGLGGSDAPKVFNIGYGSKYALWAEKFYGRPLNKMTSFQQRGHDLEPLVAAKVAERHGLDELVEGGWRDHPEHGWLFANTDYETDGGATLVECKVSDWRWKGHDWGDDGDPNGLPLYIDVQVHHQLEVARAERAIVGVLFADTWDCRTYEIKPDRDIEARIVDAEHQFWHDNVLAGVAPELGDPMSTWEALRLLTEEPGTSTELPTSAVALVDEYLAVKADRLTAEKTEKRLRAELAAVMGDNETGFIDGEPVVFFRQQASGGGARRLTISNPYQGDK